MPSLVTLALAVGPVAWFSDAPREDGHVAAGVAASVSSIGGDQAATIDQEAVELRYGLPRGFELRAFTSSEGRTSAALPPNSATQPTRICGSIGVRSIGAAAPSASTSSDERTMSTELGARWSHRDGLFSVGATALPTDAALGLDVGTRVALSRVTLSARAGLRTDEVMTWRGTAELPIAADFAAIVGVVGAQATAGDGAAASDWVTGVRYTHRFAEAYLVGGGGMSGDDGADWALNAGVSIQLGAARRATVVTASPYFTPAEPDDDTIVDVADDELRAELPVERDADTLIAQRPEIEDTGDELVPVGDPIFFAKDRKRLRRAFVPALDAMVAHLKEHPELELVDIEGHADESGPRHWNLELSRLRAQAVADYFVARGIEEHRLRVSGAGDADPASDLAEENRRVVFRVLTRTARHSSR